MTNPKGLIFRCGFLLIILMFSTSAFAQLSTLGKEFYVGFMDNNTTPNSTPPRRDKAIVIITANEKTSGVIRTPKQSIPFSLEAGQQLIKEFDGESENLIVRSSGEKEFKSLYISSSGNIAVHAINGREYSTDGTVVLPVNSLSKEYMVMAHHDVFGPGQSPGSNRNFESTLLVVAIENDTKIEIIPSARTVNTVPAGSPIFVTLNEGDSYQIKADGDLTGSTVRVLNGETGECKNIAVFGGNKMTSVGDCGSTGDHLFQQAYPLNTWGKSYIHIPWRGRTSGEIVKVLASQNGTQVRVNGQLIGTVDAGKFLKFEFGKNEVVAIETSKPSSVAVVTKSGFCNEFGAAALGDPSIISYTPNSQRMESLIFSSGKLAGSFNQDIEHFLNVIVPKGAENQTLLNGQNIGSQFKPVPGVDFAYAQVQINKGVNSLSNPEGFIGYAYGSGSIEAYGFAIGAQLEKIQYEIETKYDFDVEGDKVACLNQEGLWKILPDNSLFTDFAWDFGDGTPLVKGQEVPHTFKKEGKFKVKVLASTGSGRCDQKEEFTFDVEVKKVSAEIAGPKSVCPEIDEFTYVLENKVGVKSTYWEVEGGTIISETDSTITIKWGAPNLTAFVKAIPLNEFGCQGELVELKVEITDKIEPGLPEGPSGICGAQVGNLVYSVPFPSNDRAYAWTIIGGQILSGQNSEKIEVVWNLNASVKTLFFEESSKVNGACKGVSEVLKLEIYPEFKANQANIQDPACPGVSDGFIKLTPSGGSGIYTYSWSHDPSLKESRAENLEPGIYEITIADASGCDFELLTIEIKEPIALEISGQILANPVSCAESEDGSVSFGISGGTPPFTVVGQNSIWDANRLTIFDFPMGEFSLTVLDSRGCTLPVEGEITGPDPLTLTFQEASPGCPDGLDGELEAIPSGGTAPYFYLWEDGSIGKNLDQLSSGDFKVTVTDSNGCTVSGTGTVSLAVPQVRMPTGFDPEKGPLAPVSNCTITYELMVWDRWGELLYSGIEGWAGRFKNDLVPPGVYSYYLKFEYFEGNEEVFIDQKGSFTLIR